MTEVDGEDHDLDEDLTRARWSGIEAARAELVTRALDTLDER